MADTYVPRVNFEVMQRFQGRRVALVGRVTATQDGCWVVKTSDDSDIKVQPNTTQSTTWGDTEFVEVIGRVVDARTLQEESHVNLKGPAVDMRLYNEMVKLATGKYMSLFAL